MILNKSNNLAVWGKRIFLKSRILSRKHDIAKISSNQLFYERNIQWIDFTIFFRIGHKCKCGKTRNYLSPKNISSNQLFSKIFSKTVDFTKFLSKICYERGGRISVIFTLCFKILVEKYIVKSIWRMNVDFTEILRNNCDSKIVPCNLRTYCYCRTAKSIWFEIL